MRHTRLSGSPRAAAVAGALGALLFVLASASTIAQVPAPAAAQTPTEVFVAYRAALASAKAFSDIAPFMESQGRAMIERMPEAQQAAMFGLMKKFEATFLDVKVAGETISSDTAAVLTLTGTDPKGQPATGSVPMVKEATGWKVGPEKWSSKPR